MKRNIAVEYSSGHRQEQEPPIRELPASLRPRELVDRYGAENVPTDVLLAVLLRSGVKGVNVRALAQKLLKRYRSLTELSRVSVEELAGVEGIGPVKARVIKAALELGRRLTEEALEADGVVIRGAADAAAQLRGLLRSREVESFVILLLDTKNRLKRPPLEISRGILDSSLVHPREVFREAIRSSASAVILGHNHPSGDPNPSSDDIRITEELVRAGRVVQIRVLDHIVIGRPRRESDCDFVSLRESGLVQFSD